MSTAKGLLLLASFFLAWGVFTGINAALLAGFAGTPPGAISFLLCVGGALLETFCMVELADRFLVRARVLPRPGPRGRPRDDERARMQDFVVQWADWLRKLATAPEPAGTPPGEIVSAKLFEGVRGTLLYREPYLGIGGDQHSFSVPPLDVPCIYPDYNGGRLIIQQALDRVPGGAVEVLVARRRGENEVETFPPRRIQLECTEPPTGSPYWYADIPLKSLIGDFRPGDDLIYCVVAAPAP